VITAPVFDLMVAFATNPPLLIAIVLLIMRRTKNVCQVELLEVR
jgi:hypothetical protein